MNYVHAIICLFHIVQHYSFTNKGTFSAMNYAGRLDSMVLRDPPYVTVCLSTHVSPMVFPKHQYSLLMRITDLSIITNYILLSVILFL